MSQCPFALFSQIPLSSLVTYKFAAIDCVGCIKYLTQCGVYVGVCFCCHVWFLFSVHVLSPVPYTHSMPSQKCVVLSVKDTVWAAKQVVLDKLNQVYIHMHGG